MCVRVCALPGRAAQAPYHPGTLLAGIRTWDPSCRKTPCTGSGATLRGSVGRSARSVLAVSAGSHHPAGWLGLGCTMAPLQPRAAARCFPARETTRGRNLGQVCGVHGGDEEQGCLARHSHSGRGGMLLLLGLRAVALSEPTAQSRTLPPPAAPSTAGREA